ncbi:MAG: SDR family NAD(P)-dependent oxidoreductase [Actinobacteria bacterium]|nr:MAG: SDR family NAD(P)-dependent oxidoreductase [Actinomycetota bacterium]
MGRAAAECVRRENRRAGRRRELDEARAFGALSRRRQAGWDRSHRRVGCLHRNVECTLRTARRPRLDSARDRRRRADVLGCAQPPGLPLTRIAVVTGASSGIGAAIARLLAERGWHTVLLARREDRLRALAAEVGGEYEVCDVGRREEIERVAANVLERHPEIQLLVNNAGIPGRRSFTEIDLDRLEEVLRVNYLGAVWCLRAFLPALEAAGRSDVVNIVSVAGAVAFGPAGPYSASKHAELAFSRSTAAELRSRGIHVHTVNPGFVETEGFPQATVLRSALMRRLVVEPEHIAKHVLDVIERDKRETFVPALYRFAAIAQAVAPGLVARIASRSGYRL